MWFINEQGFMELKNPNGSNDYYDQKRESFKLPGNKIVNWFKYFQSIPPDEWKNLNLQQRQKEKDYYSDMYQKDMWMVNNKGWLLLKQIQNMNYGTSKNQQKNSQKIKTPPSPIRSKSKSPTPRPTKPPKIKSSTFKSYKFMDKSQKEEHDDSEESESDSEKEEEKEKKKKKRNKLKKNRSPTNSPKIFKAIPVPVYTPIMPQSSYQPPPPQHYSNFHPPQTTHFQSNSLSNPLATSNPFYFKSF